MNLKFFLHFLISSIFRLILLLIIIFIPTIWVIQDNSKIQEILKNKILTALEQEWHSKIKVQNYNINFFTGQIIFNNGTVTPENSLDKSFIWSFEKAKTRFSRFLLFTKHKLSLGITLENVKACTLITNQEIGLKKHLNNIFNTKTESLDVFLKYIKINNLDLNIFFKEKQNFIENINLKLTGNLLANNIDPYWQANLKLKNGIINLNNQELFKNISGETNFYSKNNWNLDLNKKFVFNEKEYILQANINNLNQEIILSDLKKDVNLKIAQNKVSGNIDLNLINNIYQIFNNKKILNDNITSICKIDLDIKDFKNVIFSGKINLENLKFKDSNLCSLDLDINKNNSLIWGNFLAQNILPGSPLTGTDLFGKFNINFKNYSGNLLLKNKTDILIPKLNNFLIKKNNFATKISFNKEFNITGKLITLLSNNYINFNNSFSKNYKINSDYKISKNNFNFSGLFNNKNFVLNFILDNNLNPNINLTNFLYLDKNYKLIEIKKDSKNFLIGKIDYNFIKSFLPEIIEKNLLGKNIFLYLKLNPNILNNISGQAILKGGKLYIPGNYNPIDSIITKFCLNLAEKKFELENWKIKFIKGNICSPKTILCFNKDFSLNYMFCPLKINNILFNWQKDFYSFIYGNLFLTKNINPDNLNNNIKITGDIILKKTLIKESNFNSKNSLPTNIDIISTKNNNVEFNINLINEQPIRVKNSFLDSYINLKLKLKGLWQNDTFSIPKIAGKIDIKKGFLHFMQHKLNIEYGQIEFMPNQSLDPIIELLAKNKIKKYLISLQASGSMQKPNIILQSNPDLTEEEILALLLGGSENLNFQENLPNILVQNINNMFSSDSKFLPEKTNSFLKKLFWPLKYVQITPDFSNESGYNGIKGTLSVDLNNQLSAQVQKNFNQEQDVSFKLEYLLTDDINFKIVKDQRGDIGSEVEVNFKL